MNDPIVPPPSRRRWLIVVAAAVFIIVAAVAVGEWLGWPVLVAPLQRMLSEKLDRRVRFSFDGEAVATPATGFHIRFIGGVHLIVPAVEVAAPAWGKTPHMLIARDVVLDLRYIDLWRAHRGDILRIENLQVALVGDNLERLADGRATWRFGPNQDTTPAMLKEPMPSPLFGNLQVTSGTVRYRDVPLATDVEVRLSLVDSAATLAPGSKTSGGAAVASPQAGNVLKLDASGQYRTLPLKLTLASEGVLPWTTDEASAVPVGVSINATVGPR